MPLRDSDASPGEDRIDNLDTHRKQLEEDGSPRRSPDFSEGDSQQNQHRLRKSKDDSKSADDLNDLTISDLDQGLQSSSGIDRSFLPGESFQGSVRGVFGDSEEESSSKSGDEDSMNLNADQETNKDSFQFLTSGTNLDNSISRLSGHDSVNVRKGSDAGGTVSLGTDDEIPLNIRMLEPRRQSSYRNIRSFSLQPQIPDEGSDEEGQVWNNETVENTGPFVTLSPTRPPLPSGKRRDSSNQYEGNGNIDKLKMPNSSQTHVKETSQLNSDIDKPKALKFLNAVDEEENGHKDRAEAEEIRILQAPGPADGLERAAPLMQPRREERYLEEKDKAQPSRRPPEAMNLTKNGPIFAPVIIKQPHANMIYEANDDNIGYGGHVFPSFETLCAPSFSQFAMLQIQPAQLLLVGNEYLYSDDGPSHLDCFVLNQELEFGDHYRADSSDPVSAAAVGSLCLPDGLRVRYIPRAGLEGARRMGLVGPNGDTCHVIVFTNAQGITDHGVAITIQWEMNLKKNERQGLSEAMYKRRRRRRAARKIQRFWRNRVKHRILAEALDISGFEGVSSSDLKAEITVGELNVLKKALQSKSDRQLASSKNKSPMGNSRRQLKKRGISKKLNSARGLARQNDAFLEQHSNCETDTSEVEAVTRAAIMRASSMSQIYSNDDNFRNNKTQPEDADNGVSKNLRPGLMKKGSSRNGIAASVRSVFSNRSAMSLNATSSSPHVTRSMRTMPRPNLRCEALARESYETMKENDRLGSVCVIQKCYTLIGCQPDEHVLLLGPLQQLVNSERNDLLSFRKSKSEANNNKKKRLNSMHFVDEERRLEWELKERRRVILRAMREKLRLTTRQALVTHPRSHLEYVEGRLHYFETTIPEIPNCKFIRLPLPLPKIGKEWALAQFLLDLGPEAIILCLKLMLLERSILVLGDNLQCVTTTACALIELLKPFEWASAFMPVLPLSMLDFINSPVPFIAGVSARDVYAIENDARVLDAMSNGMSLLNLKSNTLHITSENGISNMISLDPYLLEKLKFLRTRLQYYTRKNPHTALRNFNNFLNFGLSRQESLSLHSVAQVIEQHFSRFCGDLTLNGKAWKRYGTIDVETNEFIFHPEWFLNPMKADQEFQKAMVHTQLFSGFVHEKRQDQMEMNEIMEGELGHYIADWVYEKWSAKKQQRERYKFKM
mmetsp:Transcript_29122/g.42969  ORF Transcript_29122/g.42969 Transcript_29122/m.42969 type:complete len:1177 (+) Transcript_29122:347-3877(+)|eukprot:CAMPEP_0194229454 /NCGR_PEP_ID=MMETSP0156-20130528/43896_1 /TAXON_ID=33649 /ORGANISM="Thalassionema nitzschioides, Strain L26-B" /LENGTH=1176 /DNA_ID=CAMNT_0038962005 /DNA_START=196 /DNA_END=3726 /DNA_ORIENTATION=+